MGLDITEKWKIASDNGGTKKISSLLEFVQYKNVDVSSVVNKRNGAE